MSKVFKNELKTFTSDITGEEKEYKVNNIVWIHLKELFDTDQKDLDEGVLKK